MTISSKFVRVMSLSVVLIHCAFLYICEKYNCLIGLKGPQLAKIIYAVPIVVMVGSNRVDDRSMKITVQS